MNIWKNLIQRNKETKKRREQLIGERGSVIKLTLWESAVFLLIVFCFLNFAQSVFAHGGGILVVGNQPVGEYAVSVWVNPPVPRANETLHMTVGIAGTEQEPVLDAAVQIDIFEAGTDLLSASAPATTEQSVNRLFYETDFPQIKPGFYDVVVRVDGVQASGDVTFAMEMKHASITSWVTAVLVAIGVIIIGFVVYSWRRQDKGRVRKRYSSPKRPSRQNS